MTDETNRPRRRLAGIVLATVAVAAVASAAVYRNGWPGGKEQAAACQSAGLVAARLKPLVRGAMAPVLVAEAPQSVADLGFMTVDGKPVRLSDFAGKALLLNLWATWCAPCREEMPALDRLEGQRGGDRFQVVAVNIDVGDPARPAAFMADAGLTRLDDYRDPKMAIFNTLKTRQLAIGMPTTLLVDAAGCQVAVLHGPAAWDAPEALAMIDALTGP